MYDFLRGPMMWISSIICVVGLAYQLIQLIRMTRIKDPAWFTINKKKKDKTFTDKIKRISSEFAGRAKASTSKIDRTILKTQPSLAVFTSVFHMCLIITPIFLVGHNVLFFESWGISICSLSEAASDVLTVILIACGIAFLIRRMFIARVRAVSTLWDYVLLFITVFPFVSGFIAYHQLAVYETAITVHIIAGELMLIAMGLTKLSHMIFFFFARFFIGSEYSFRGGSRSWY